jgi:hypothetical protein
LCSTSITLPLFLVQLVMHRRNQLTHTYGIPSLCKATSPPAIPVNTALMWAPQFLHPPPAHTRSRKSARCGCPSVCVSSFCLCITNCRRKRGSVMEVEHKEVDPPQMTNQCLSLTQWLDSTCQIGKSSRCRETANRPSIQTAARHL